MAMDNAFYLIKKIFMRAFFFLKNELSVGEAEVIKNQRNLRFLVNFHSLFCDLYLDTPESVHNF